MLVTMKEMLADAKAKKYAMILSSGSAGVYDALISQYNDIINYSH